MEAMLGLFRGHEQGHGIVAFCQVADAIDPVETDWKIGWVRGTSSRTSRRSRCSVMRRVLRGSWRVT